MSGFTINMADEGQRTRFAVAQARGQARLMKAGMTVRGLSRKELQRRIAVWTDSPCRSGRQIEMSIADCTVWLGKHNAQEIA